MSERDDDFLSRWSRRKAGSRDGGLQKKPDVPEHKPGRMRTGPPPPKEAAPVAEADGEAPLQHEATLKEEQPLVPVDEPSASAADQQADPADFDDFDFDSLNYASDYTKFMKEGVPEAVKRRALRMLWGSNPILANLDGLNDYDEDFTDAALAVKVLSSNYKPGSGYLTEEEIDASYSEEARKAGPQPVEEETEVGDAEDIDVEEMDDDEASDGNVRTAAAEPNVDDEDEKDPGGNDTA